MNRLLSAAALVLALGAPAYAACYPNGVSAVQYWTGARDLERLKFNGHLTTWTETIYARLLTNADLYDRGAINFTDYMAYNDMFLHQTGIAH